MAGEDSAARGLYMLCMEAQNRGIGAAEERQSTDDREKVGVMDNSQLVGAPVMADVSREGAPASATVEERSVTKRKRGRPPGRQAKPKNQKDEEEDVCFICFDGGSLVLCDRRGCPKAYHPACIKRDEAFFRSKAKWNCGWHICSGCQKAAHFMCYTCTYSLCKTCTKDADFLIVRENKGFCTTCLKTIMLLENCGQGTKEMAQVDFDDKSSWEYLFKIYWTYLKEKLSLTLNELIQAQSLRKVAGAMACEGQALSLHYFLNHGRSSISNGHSLGHVEANDCKRRTTEQPILSNKGGLLNLDKSSSNIGRSEEWASKELLEFVADMRNGDRSVISQFEVQSLVLDYIERNNLHDPHEKSEINCDLRLINLFGKPRVGRLEMLKLLEVHIVRKDDFLKKGNIVDALVNESLQNDGKNACESNALEKPSQVDSSDSVVEGWNNQLGRGGSETPVASLSTGSGSPVKSGSSVNYCETDEVWNYRDPHGKVQGPFCLMYLQKWSKSGYFQTDMRIWSINDDESESLLLTDVLNKQFQKVSTLQYNISISSPEVQGTSDSRYHCETMNSVDIDGKQNEGACKSGNAVAHSSVTIDCAMEGSHSSNCTTAVVDNNDMKNSSKCQDSLEVKDSYVDQAKVHCHGPSSTITEKPQETSPCQTGIHEGRRCTSPDNGNWCSHGNATSPDTAAQSPQPNQSNGQDYLDQSSGENGMPVPVNDSSNNWASKSDFASVAKLANSSGKDFGNNVTNLPSPTLKSSKEDLEGQTSKDQELVALNDPNQDLTTQNLSSITLRQSDGDQNADSSFKNMRSALPNPGDEDKKLNISESRDSVSNAPVQDSGSLAPTCTNPSVNQRHSGLLSMPSLKPPESASDHPTTSASDKLTHSPSTSHPACNTSGWQDIVNEPIELSTLAEESVSDLLAEVDAMESQCGPATPTSVTNYIDELFQDSKTDTFTSIEGLRPSFDSGKHDALSSMGNIQFSQSCGVDPVKCGKQSSLSKDVKIVTKPTDISADNLEAPSRSQIPGASDSRAEAKPIENGSKTLQGNNYSEKKGSTRDTGRGISQGTDRGYVNMNRSTSGGPTGRESHSKHRVDKHVSPRDSFRSGESGFARERPTSRHSSFSATASGGSGSYSRPPSKIQRPCKFYRNGYCRKGSSCDYLHL
ncbi:hypothetical protein NMG60_11026280 [Bertholletia excelsa]